MSETSVIDILASDENARAWLQAVGAETLLVAARSGLEAAVEIVRAICGQGSAMTETQAMAVLLSRATEEERRRIVQRLINDCNAAKARRIAECEAWCTILWKLLVVYGPLLLAAV